MTQQIDPSFAPAPQPTADPTTPGWPTAGIPTQGYPPPGQGYPTYSVGQAYPTQQPYPAGQTYATPTYGGPAPAGLTAEGGGRGSRLWIIVSALVGVVVVLGGVLGWVLLSPSQPAAAPAPAPAASQPVTAPGSPVAPSAPSQDSPATAAAAREQLSGALNRYNQAAQRFSQQAQTAGASSDMNAMRTAITDFRAATYGYDAEIRAITFPNAQQTVVNTQLLPATGRLVTDLDQFATLDPATVKSTGNRVMADLQTSMTLTQQVMAGLGG